MTLIDVIQNQLDDGTIAALNIAVTEDGFQVSTRTRASTGWQCWMAAKLEVALALALEGDQTKVCAVYQEARAEREAQIVADREPAPTTDYTQDDLI